MSAPIGEALLSDHEYSVLELHSERDDSHEESNIPLFARVEYLESENQYLKSSIYSNARKEPLPFQFEQIASDDTLVLILYWFCFFSIFFDSLDHLYTS